MKWIVTGAAGFIGCNAVAAFVRRGDEVVGLDNLSRPGAELNLEWLQRESPRFTFARCDVRDAEALERVIAEHADAAAVLHLAGQVAVTTSVRDPREDFEVNALGTFNVCEAVRRRAPEALLLNASTNKVYGAGSSELVLADGRWTDPAAPGGTPESRPLDFQSPYACSKGAADQYVVDYGRTYGLRTVSLRQSCIYGPRQFGIEDQGWVAWFSLAALAGEPITVYGDGRQVRDVLYVDDLVDVYARCAESPDVVAGQAVNVGGGPANVLSLLELLGVLEERLGRAPAVTFAEARVGDQRVYVSDVSKARGLLGWAPATSAEEGVGQLLAWLEENLDEVAAIVAPGKRAQAVAPAGG
jgi:CDP-paratose 2-epimerase